MREQEKERQGWRERERETGNYRTKREGGGKSLKQWNSGEG